MTALLKVEKLVIADAAGRPVVDGLDLTLEAGEFAALVGESGSGKSMAARAILGLLPPGLRQTGGHVRFEGTDLATLAPDALRRLRGPGIGMVFQEPMTALNPAMTVGAQMAEGLALHEGLRGHALRARVEEWLARVGIPDPAARADAFPHAFSGGMRQRIMLASVMALRPRLLLADEPTTALDCLTQAEIMELMTGLTREHGTAVLLISHDLGLVARHAARIHVLERGVKVESGPTGPTLAAPAHPYTGRLVAALPRPKPPAPPQPPQPAVAAAEDVVLRYRGEGWLGRRLGPAALEGVTMSVSRGEVVAVVGGSGSGKSTLGRALLRLTDVTEGRVMFAGQDITHARGRALADLRARAQLIHQDPYGALDPRMTVAAIVGEPLRRAALPRAERVRQAEAMLDRVGLAGLGHRHPHELSGGQRQRVAIARAVIRRPTLIVADEPVSALDMTVQRKIMALLAELQAETGFACLFISHDFGAVREIADRIVVLQAGRVVEEGRAAEVHAAPSALYTRRLIAAAPVLETGPLQLRLG